MHQIRRQAQSKSGGDDGDSQRDGGAFQRFQGGQVYWSPKTPATVVNNGPIFAEWGRQGYEGGRLGYPVADSTPIPGGFEQRFERGVIALVNGVATAR